MKCTNCSQKIKPVVALDIDGTLGDFHGHFIAFAENYLGVESHFSIDHVDVWNDYDGSMPFREWFCEEYEVDERTWRDIKLAYRQGGMKRTMPCFKSSEPLVRYIMGQGAELWLTTSRPAYRLDNIDPDTQEWCRRNRITFDHLLYDDDKYDLLAQMVDTARVVAVLDDLPQMYDAAFAKFGPDVPILVKSTYNRAIRRNAEINAGVLQAAAHAIGHRIYNWKQTHDQEEAYR